MDPISIASIMVYIVPFAIALASLILVGQYDRHLPYYY